VVNRFFHNSSLASLRFDSLAQSPADALLSWVIGLELRAPVCRAPHAQRRCLAGHVVTVAGGRDGIQTDRVGLSVLLSDSGGEHSKGLALPVRHLLGVVDYDVAGFAGRVGSDDPLRRHDLADVRVGVLECVNGNFRLQKRCVRVC